MQLVTSCILFFGVKDALSLDPRLADICTFKVAKEYIEGLNIPYANAPAKDYARSPLVVLYIPNIVIPGNLPQEERQQIFESIMDPIVNALYEKFRDKIQEYALKDVAPQYNRTMNDLMYITGGNRDIKNRPANAAWYTPDRIFVKPEMGGVTYYKNLPPK